MELVKKPEDCLCIDEVRQQIDRIDHQIIGLFAKRQKYVHSILRFKSDENEVVAPDRKNFVIDERAKTAAEQGLDPVLFKNIYTLLVEANIRNELEIFKQNQIIKTKSE
jgi:isochorismate pyruvate lyase